MTSGTRVWRPTDGGIARETTTSSCLPTCRRGSFSNMARTCGERRRPARTRSPKSEVARPDREPGGRLPPVTTGGSGAGRPLRVTWPCPARWRGSQPPRRSRRQVWAGPRGVLAGSDLSAPPQGAGLTNNGGGLLWLRGLSVLGAQPVRRQVVGAASPRSGAFGTCCWWSSSRLFSCRASTPGRHPWSGAFRSSTGTSSCG